MIIRNARGIKFTITSHALVNDPSIRILLPLNCYHERLRLVVIRRMK